VNARTKERKKLAGVAKPRGGKQIKRPRSPKFLLWEKRIANQRSPGELRALKEEKKNTDRFGRHSDCPDSQVIRRGVFFQMNRLRLVRCKNLKRPTKTDLLGDKKRDQGELKTYAKSPKGRVSALTKED